MVLIRLTASAPASAAAAAMGTMSCTFGVNLAMIGKGQAPTDPSDQPAHRAGIDSQVQAMAHVGTGDVESTAARPGS